MMFRREMSKTGEKVVEQSRYRGDGSSLMSDNNSALRLGRSDRNCTVPKKETGCAWRTECEDCLLLYV
jgi:hypothetical protein